MCECWCLPVENWPSFSMTRWASFSSPHATVPVRWSFQVLLNSVAVSARPNQQGFVSLCPLLQDLQSIPICCNLLPIIVLYYYYIRLFVTQRGGDVCFCSGLSVCVSVRRSQIGKYDKSWTARYRYSPLPIVFAERIIIYFFIGGGGSKAAESPFKVQNLFSTIKAPLGKMHHWVTPGSPRTCLLNSYFSPIGWKLWLPIQDTHNIR